MIYLLSLILIFLLSLSLSLSLIETLCGGVVRTLCTVCSIYKNGSLRDFDIGQGKKEERSWRPVEECGRHAKLA